jgi:hypothetical protein
VGFYFLHFNNNFNRYLNAMDWENRLKQLNGYDISFEIKQGYYHIAIVYENGWDILSPENESIYLEERNGVYHYIAAIDSVKIEDIFNVIDATIEYNMDLQKKLILFKEKTEELQTLFANEDLETLQTIQFTFNKQETKKKTKKSKTKTEKKEKTSKKTKGKSKKTEKEETKPTETVTEETSENTTPYYDEADEIVTMGDNYMEELER